MAKFKAPKEKPRASGTMTEAQFWQKIRSALRNLSRWWQPAQECKKEARRPSQSENKRIKWEYQCKSCSLWFPDKEVKVDHIIPCGSLNSYDDLVGFVKRLYCEKEGFQLLCTTCHDTKSVIDRQNIKNEKLAKD